MPAAYQALYSEDSSQENWATFTIEEPLPPADPPQQRSLPADYRRPDLRVAEYLDARGEPIPYGHRWGSGQPPENTYSVVTHPERFAPVLEVARALAGYLSEHYEMTSSQDDWLHLEPAVGAPLRFRLEEGGEVTGVTIGAGLLAERRYPSCGCDACDEDVAFLLEDMENLVFAVVQGDFAEWRQGRWIHHGLHLGGALSESAGQKVVDREQWARIKAAAKALPGRYPAWPAV